MASTVRFHRQVLGTSHEGRPIEGVFLGHHDIRGRTVQALDTLFIGVFHGDEGISCDLLELFIRSLINPFSDIRLPDWEQRPTLIIPCLNPDGLEANTRMNAHGVDLNRNFPTMDWREENADNIYYSGPAPASEPETQLVIRLIETFHPRKIVTVHSPYKVINYDGPARPLAEAMAACSGYEVVDSIGYPTPGSFGTWAGKERQIPVITLELPEEEPLDQVWQDNWASLLAAINFDARNGIAST